MIAAVAIAARPGSVSIEPRDDDRDELAEVPRRLGAWFGLVVLALVGPQYSEASLLPATLALAVAALPIARLLVRPRALRALAVAVAVGVHAVTWASGLALYSRLAGEASARMAALAAAPPGSVAVVAPYSELRPGFWFFGEDWQAASTRELLARRIFGLADIDMRPRFRTMTRNPHVTMRLDAISGATPDKLVAARVPSPWPGDLGVARFELDGFTDRLAAVAPDASARLVATDLGVPGGRAVEIGHIEHGALVSPKVRHVGPDPQDRFAITFEASLAGLYPEAWLIGPRGVDRIDDTGGKVEIAPMVVGRWAVVACNRDSCLAIDAFVLDL